jgi:hypothetical protein
VSFGDLPPWSGAGGGGGGGFYSGNVWYTTTTSTVTPSFVPTYQYQIYPGPGVMPAPSPEPRRPQFDDELEWLRCRVQDVVDIFDRAAT